MKLKSSVFLATALISSAAFAQEAAPAATPAASPAAETPAAAAPAAVAPAAVIKTITPYGILQGIVNLADSERKSAPDFQQYITRFGLKISEGIAKAQFELEMSRDNNKLIGVRQANAGLDLPTKTSVRFGRNRLGAPAAWGVDATTTLDGFGGADGVIVGQTIDISEGNTLKVQAGVASALSVSKDSKPAINYSYGDNKAVNTNSKAILASVDATISGARVGVFYSIDGRSQLTKEVKGDDPATTAKEVDAPATYGKVQHLEASVGYDMDGIGGGVAYERITVASKKSFTSVAGELKNGMSVGGGTSTSDLISVGVNGDSTLFGVSGIAQAGDKFTYGASYALSSASNSTHNAAEKKAAKDSNVSQFAVGAGYNVGGLTLELDWALSSTKGKTFKNNKGVAAMEKQAQVAYLTSIYAF